MARKGRKRQTGQREPTGRLARSAADPGNDYAPAAIKRLTDCAIRGIADSAYGTPLGRLYLEGYLTAAQFAAGRRFDSLLYQYLRAIAAPQPNPRSHLLDYGPPSPDIDPDSRLGRDEMANHQAVVAAMREASSVLANCGKAVETAVRDLCEARELPAGWSGRRAVATGLSALAEHWHLTRIGQRRRA
jgi:hypothetical protein